MTRRAAHNILLLICLPGFFGISKGLQFLGFPFLVVVALGFPIGFLAGRCITFLTEDILFDDDLE